MMNISKCKKSSLWCYFNEWIGQVSQLYTQNKINYDNYVYSLKESDNWEVYINIKPINTQWIHL